MRVGAGLSQTPESALAAAEAADAAAQPLDGRSCSLAVAFVSPAHLEGVADVVAAVEARLEPTALVGAVAQGVVGPHTEAEIGPAVAVWCASFDQGHAEPFRTWAVRAREGGMAVVGWPDTHPGDVTVLLADPYTYPAPELVARLGSERPGHRIVGGLLTGGRGASRLLLGDEVHDEGAVGVVLSDVAVDTLVSQGCRPVGEPYVVTRADHNVIAELGGMPAAERLRETFEGASASDRERMRQGLQVGVVADEYRDEFQPGDFLIRSVLAADFELGGVTVGDVVEVGRTIQFQVRDPRAAHEDLAAHLDRARRPAPGALLFTCNGRGERFFGRPHHDVETVERHLEAGVAGAFCAGEIGPVGARSFLHGFTASLALFGAEGGQEEA